MRVVLSLAVLFAISCAGSKSAGPVSLSPDSIVSAGDASSAANAASPGLTGDESNPGRVNPKEWRRVLDEHTRRSEAYDWAVRQADLRAALVTPKLRKAYLTHRDEFQGRFSEEVERELVALGEPDPGVDVESRPRPEGEEQVVFFVSMYVTDMKNRDIAASYTIWETSLSRGDSTVKPIRIDTIKLSPAVMDVFPFVDRFDDLYVVRFPLTDAQGRPFLSPGGEPLKLRVRSALADTEVEWTLSD